MNIELYYNIDKIIENYDNKIVKLATLNSYERTSEYLFNKIIKLINKKDKILLSYISYDKKLRLLNNTTQKILELKYKDKKSNKEISQLLNISIRTILRYLHKFEEWEGVNERA